MKNTLQKLNPLPMRTWRWLGVNDTAYTGEMPVIEPLATGYPNWSIPAESQAEGDMPLNHLHELKGGMGEEAKAFVEKNHNASFALHVAEGKDAGVLSSRVQDTAVVEQGSIVAEKESKITVLQVADAQSRFYMGLTRILAKQGATVRVIQVNMVGNAGHYMSDFAIEVEDNAKVEIVQLMLGAAQTIAGSHARLVGKKSHFGIETAYLGDGNRVMDFNMVAEHIGQKTTSEIKADGALFDQSEKIYRGTIDFVSGCSYSVGHEQENVLLFSPAIRNRSVPLILCGEENVEGQHAATIGKLDAAKLFYLASRGLSEDQAKRLMVEAQFAPILAQIPDEKVREMADGYLTERMRAL